MKKILLIAALVVLGLNSQSAILATNTTTNGVYQLLSTGAKVSRIQIISGSATAPILYLYDANWQGTNYSNDAYITVSSYITNLVTTNVSALSGMTNYWTNRGTFTYTNTVAASTSDLLPAQVLAGTSVAGGMVTYNPNYLFNVGLTVQCTTNATLIITYGSLSGN